MTDYPAKSVFAPDRAPDKDEWIQFLADEAGLTVNTIAEAEAYSDTQFIPGVIRILEANRVFFYNASEARPRDGINVIQDARGRRYRALEVSTTAVTTDGLFKVVSPTNGTTWTIPRPSSLIEVRATRNAQTLRLPDFIVGHTTVVALKNNATSQRLFTVRSFRTTQMITNDLPDTPVTADRHNFLMNEQEIIFFVSDGSTWFAIDSDEAFANPKRMFERVNDSITTSGLLNKTSDASTRRITLSKETSEVLIPTEWHGVNTPALNRLHVFTDTRARTFTGTLPSNAVNGDCIGFVKAEGATGSVTVTYSVPAGKTINIGGRRSDQNPTSTTTGLLGDKVWLFHFEDDVWNVYEGFGALGITRKRIYDNILDIFQVGANTSKFDVDDASETIALLTTGGTSGGGNSSDFAGFLNYAAPSASAISAKFGTIYSVSSASEIDLPDATDADIGRTIWLKNATDQTLDINRIITTSQSYSVRVNQFALGGTLLPDVAADDYVILEYSGNNFYTRVGRVEDIFTGLTLDSLNRIPINVGADAQFGNNYLHSVSTGQTNLTINSSVPAGMVHFIASGSISVALPAATSSNKNIVIGLHKGSDTANQILTVTSSSTISGTVPRTWSRNDQRWFRSTGSAWEYIDDLSTIYTNQSGVYDALKKIMPTATFTDSTETVSVAAGGGGGSAISERVTFQLTSSINISVSNWLNKMVAVTSSGTYTIALSDAYGTNGDRIIFANSGLNNFNVRANRPNNTLFAMSVGATRTQQVQKLSGKWYFV